MLHCKSYLSTGREKVTLGNKKSGISWFVLPILLFLVGLLGISIFLLRYFDNPTVPVTEPAISNQIQNTGHVEQEPKFVPEVGLESRSFSFEYLCQPYTIHIPIYQSKYVYFSNLDRDIFLLNRSGKNPEEEYYKQFLLSDQDEDTIQKIISEIQYLTQANTSDDLVTAVVSFVQHIEYDCEKLFSYEHMTEHDYQTYYPYETLFLNKAVCGDTSLLLAKILNHLGYGSAFLIYEDQNHMALGIRCPNSQANFVEDGVGYCYIETTAPARIGVIPQGINESYALTNPRIIKVADGQSFERMTILAEQRKEQVETYGQYILSLSSCSEISLYKKIEEAVSTMNGIKEDLLSLQGDIDSLSENLDYQVEQFKAKGCQGTVSKSKYKKCEPDLKNIQSLQYTHESLVIDYNNLVEEYNTVYEVYESDFKTFDSIISSHNTCSGLVLGKQPPDILDGRNE
jgi:hypothetical protein